MNLFIITKYPTRASFRQRIWVYLDILRANGISCEVAELPVGILARRKLFKQAAKFDAVLLHKKGWNFLDTLWLHCYAQRIIYDFDDAVMYDKKEPARPSRKRQKSFQRTIKISSMVIAGNSYLAKHARRFNHNVKVLPTGLDTTAYDIEIKTESDNKIRLVWIGSKSTLKYLAEIKPALEQIGERFKNVILRIICDDFFDLKNMKVEKCRWSLAGQYSDLLSSDIGLAPLPDNRFTRGKCGFKILQYSAAGLPVVASPVGVNAEYVCDGVTGFHAVDIRQWVNTVSKLIENQELRKRMAQEGNVQVQRFDLKVLGEELVNVVKGCLKKPDT